MELFSILKKFQNISPDKARAEQSKSVILSVPQRKYRRSPLAIWQEAFKFLTARPAFALASILLLLIAGGVSFSLFSPGKPNISGLDPTSLKAEAEAIDIQIHLSELNYRESTTPLAPKPVNQNVQKTILKQAESLGLVNQTSSASEDAKDAVGVDDALDLLTR